LIFIETTFLGFYFLVTKLSFFEIYGITGGVGGLTEKKMR
jgi:hypothetical protein